MSEEQKTYGYDQIVKGIDEKVANEAAEEFDRQTALSLESYKIFLAGMGDFLRSQAYLDISDSDQALFTNLYGVICVRVLELEKILGSRTKDEK